MRAAFAGAAFAALVTLPGLGLGTLWDNSETAYGEVAREVLLQHDPVVMHFNGAPWFVQPPLYFWLAALCAKLFGVAPFALRLPSALATIAMGGAVGYATARLAGTRTGIFAAVILSTSLMQAVVGRLAIMDALLDLAVTATILWWFRAFEPARRTLEHDRSLRPRTLILGAAAAGLGILAKGPVALVIPVMVVGLWMLWERASGIRLGAPRPGAFVAALAVAVAIVAPWTALVVARAGPSALEQLISHYSVGRYVGVIENQSGAWYYYLPVIIIGFFPWVAFLPPAFIAAVRRARAGDTFARLAVVWSLVPLVFFSFAQTKLPNYIALEWPALAIVTALWFDGVAAGRSRAAAIAAAATVPLTVGLIAVAIVVFSRNGHLGADLAAFHTDLNALAIATLATSFLTLAALIARREEWAPYVMGMCGAAVLLLVVFVAEPHAEAFKPIPRLAAVINQHRHPSDVVALTNTSGGNALVFYTRPGVITLHSVNGELDPASTRVICFSPRLFLIAPARDESRIPTTGRRRTTLSHANNDVLLLYDGPPCERKIPPPPR